MRGIRVLLVVALCCVWTMAMAMAMAMAQAQAQAEVYTWVDAQGVRHYSDHPVSQQAPPIEIQTRQPVPDHDAQVESEDNTDAANAQRITLLRPKPGALLESVKGLVGVSISVAGGLAANERLMYYLDGQTVAKSPTQALQFQLLGLPTGPHALQVALLVDGQETQRTAPIAFSVKISQPGSAATK